MSDTIVMINGEPKDIRHIIEKANKIKHKRITLKSLAKCVEKHRGLVPEREVTDASPHVEILYTVLAGTGPMVIYGVPQLLLAARKHEIKIRAKEIPANWLA